MPAPLSAQHVAIILVAVRDVPESLKTEFIEGVCARLFPLAEVDDDDVREVARRERDRLCGGVLQ